VTDRWLLVPIEPIQPGPDQRFGDRLSTLRFPCAATGSNVPAAGGEARVPDHTE
jgi:hypothetical protein